MKPIVAVIGATKSGRSTVGAELASLLDVPFTENEDLLKRDLHDLVVADPKGASQEILRASKGLLDHPGVVTLLPSAAGDVHTLTMFADLEVPIVLLTCSAARLASRANLGAPRPTTLGTPRAVFAAMVSQLHKAAKPFVEASFSTEGTVAREVAIAIRDTIART